MTTEQEQSNTHSFCDPDWHDGDRTIEADYWIKTIKVSSTPFDRPTTWTDMETSFNQMGTFVCCRIHLETAVHSMLARFPDVRIKMIERTSTRQ